MSAPALPLTFRLADAADKAIIKSFMDANWGAPHPLIQRDEFFNFYYQNGAGLQFAFAEEAGIPVALAGYIRANESETPDIWVSIWCAVKGRNGAGLELMAALPRLAHARCMACNNIRPNTMPFYTFLGYTAARLPHFYRLARLPVYQVAKVAHQMILPAGGRAVLTKVTDEAMLARVFHFDEVLRPAKDLWYLTRRYFHAPHQKYDVWTSDSSLLVTRTVPVNGTQVLRIVDYIGKPETFADLGGAISLLMQTVGAEYADCYCYGIDAQIFAAAGFCERTETDENIIPNYLTPPLYENTEYYFFTDTTKNFTMWKADGDQDRPNL
ncbi:MAG: hypothetical protein RSC73_02205 [Ruthenibacterium sp.]